MRKPVNEITRKSFLWDPHGTINRGPSTTHGKENQRQMKSEKRE